MAAVAGFWFLLVILCAHCALTAPNGPVKRQVDVDSNAIPELYPISQALDNNPYKVSLTESSDPSNPRDKRLAIVTKTGVKALLLNFIFGKIDGHLDSKIRLLNQLDKTNIAKNAQFGIAPPNSGFPYNIGVGISAAKGGILTNLLGSSSGSTGSAAPPPPSSSSDDSSGGSGSILTTVLNLSSGSGGSGSSDSSGSSGSGSILSTILSLAGGSSGGTQSSSSSST